MILSFQAAKIAQDIRYGDVVEYTDSDGYQSRASFISTDGEWARLFKMNGEKRLRVKLKNLKKV